MSLVTVSKAIFHNDYSLTKGCAMLKTVMIRSTLFVIACWISLAAHAIADAPTQINVAPGELAAALESLSKQVSIELVYQPLQIKDFKTKGVKGVYTTESAVRLLLKGTPLELQVDPSGAMLIAPVGTKDLRHLKESGTGAESQNDDSQEGRKSSSGEFRVAQLDQANSGTQVGQGKDTISSKADSLTEVVVTAQKREERLQDVPIPVSVLGAAALVDTNQLRIEDYANQVPGLNISPNGTAGTQILSIRGITTSSLSPTVGLTVDDIPIGSVTYSPTPDIDPGELSHIEVLRGPQGTLYGVSSLGGLLRYVTLDPSTDGVSGRVEAGASEVYNGPETGYNVRGSVNVPLSTDFAIRVSAFTRQDPGYIDNDLLGIRGVNDSRTNGAHFSALWTPLGNLSVKFNALYQDVRADGSDDEDVGHLLQDYGPEFGVSERKFQLYGLTVKDKFGDVSVTSVTGYNILEYSESDYFGPQELPPEFGALTQNDATRRLSQEFRMSSPLGPYFDSLAGLFYSSERTPSEQQFYSVSAATPPAITDNETGFDTYPTTYREYAVFADLTYHATEHLDIQFGGRGSRILQTHQETDRGPITSLIGDSADPVQPETESRASPVTYLFTPEYRFSPDLMAYIRLASGYRSGGPNGIAPDVPRQFQPDKTYDYDLGFKGTFFDHKFSVDASVYYIKWRDIQLDTNTPSGYSYTTNASEAKSEGVELSIEVRPLAGLKITGWGAYDHAVLTQTYNGFGNAGDHLPNTPTWSGYLAADQEFPLVSGLSGFAGASIGYQGNRTPNIGPLPSSATPGDLPAYTKADLRAGLKWGPWSARAYADNVTNQTPRVTYIGGPFGNGYVDLRPRTVGFSVARKF